MKRFPTVLAWALTVPLLIVFVMSGAAKLAGASAMVQTFATIGLGQWLRYVTGVLEVSGGVGLLIPPYRFLAALQLARTRRCVVFGTASPAKHDFLRAQGCQHPLDHDADLTAAVRAVVGEQGLDLVLDPVGGASWRRGYELLGPTGRMVAFGFSAAAAGNTRSLWRAVTQFAQVPRYSPIQLMTDNKTVTGVNMGHLFGRLDLLRPQFEALVALFDAGQIAPHVDRTFSFDEAPAAHQYLHDRKAKGKVLLVP